jgi:hypothetical protein
MKKGVPAAFMKGLEADREIAEARERWSFTVARHESVTGEGGVILDIGMLRRAGESG